jgi:hypothetical protein
MSFRDALSSDDDDADGGVAAAPSRGCTTKSLTLIIALAVLLVVVVVVAIAVPLAVVFGTGLCVLTPSQGRVYCIIHDDSGITDRATQFKLIDAASNDCLDLEPEPLRNTVPASTLTSSTTNWTDVNTGSRPRALKGFRVEAIVASICMVRGLKENDYYSINALTSDECAVAAQGQGSVKATWTRGATPDFSGSLTPPAFTHCGA